MSTSTRGEAGSPSPSLPACSGARPSARATAARDLRGPPAAQSAPLRCSHGPGRDAAVAQRAPEPMPSPRRSQTATPCLPTLTCTRRHQSADRPLLRRRATPRWGCERAGRAPEDVAARRRVVCVSAARARAVGALLDLPRARAPPRSDRPPRRAARKGGERTQGARARLDAPAGLQAAAGALHHLAQARHQLRLHLRDLRAPHSVSCRVGLGLRPAGGRPRRRDAQSLGPPAHLQGTAARLPIQQAGPARAHRLARGDARRRRAGRCPGVRRRRRAGGYARHLGLPRRGAWRVHAQEARNLRRARSVRRRPARQGRRARAGQPGKSALCKRRGGPAGAASAAPGCAT